VTIQTLAFETRSQISGNTLRGHAAVFGSLTRIGQIYERIAPGAFANALQAGSDVRALVNHDPSMLLGRTSSGTLRLQEDSEGLAFEVDIPDTTTGRDLRTLVERGDITGASFGFIPGQVARTRAEDGRSVITHTSVAVLRDISPVTFPAYSDTDIAVRADEQARTLREQIIRIRAGQLLRGY
jgi:HK97 family phage prohead protease